jgi:hypothetical protein
VRHLAEVELAGGVCPLEKAGQDIGGFLRTRGIDCVAFQELRQDPIQPNELRVIELREFPGNNLADGAKMLPRATSKSTPRSTRSSLYDFSRPCTWIAGPWTRLVAGGMLTTASMEG